MVSLLSDAPSVIEAHGGAYACSFGDSASVKAEVVSSSTSRVRAPPGLWYCPYTSDGEDGIDLERVGTFAYYQELEVHEATPQHCRPRVR